MPKRNYESLTGGTGDVNTQYVTLKYRNPGGQTGTGTGYKGLKFRKNDLVTFPGTVLTTSVTQKDILVPEITHIKCTFPTTNFIGTQLPQQDNTATCEVSKQVEITMGDFRQQQAWIEENDVGDGKVLNTIETNTTVANDAALIDLVRDYCVVQQATFDQIGSDGVKNISFNKDVLQYSHDLTDKAGHGIICYSNVITVFTALDILLANSTTINVFPQTEIIIQIQYRLKKISIQQLLIGQQSFSILH